MGRKRNRQTILKDIKIMTFILEFAVCTPAHSRIKKWSIVPAQHHTLSKIE